MSETERLIGDRHPGTLHVLQYFTSEHLPEHLQVVSRPFALLATEMVDGLADGPELTAGLRKLLEAKDCMVRAAVAAPSAAHDEPTPSGSAELVINWG